MAYDQRGSVVLDEDECRHLLELAGSSRAAGHLAINREGSPYLLPVNFSLCDQEILVRLGPGYAANHLDGSHVTFEVDDSEPYSKKGWSVVVEGIARLMTYDEVARLGRNLPEPVVMEPGVRVFSIRPEKISGRSITQDHEARKQLPSIRWSRGNDEGAEPFPATPLE
jgi:hypothetical protein